MTKEIQTLTHSLSQVHDALSLIAADLVNTRRIAETLGQMIEAQTAEITSLRERTNKLEAELKEPREVPPPIPE